VDAICINQQDKVEKISQVSRMHEIYSTASNICIWLGFDEIDPETGTADPDEIQETLDFIRQMLSLRRLDQLVQSEDHFDLCLAFVRLMRNRWFSRRWVVQELVLAKEATEQEVINVSTTLEQSTFAKLQISCQKAERDLPSRSDIIFSGSPTSSYMRS
jgi:hypothetical protein